MGFSKKIYLLRHGETAWTLSGQHTSVTDLELTENGKKEALKLKELLQGVHLDHVYCSPLKRVRETCKLVGLEKRAIIDDDLFEWRYGDYEGLTSDQIHLINPMWTVFSEDPPKGETKNEVTQRADRILQKAVQKEGTVALFSSGHFSRVLGARWLKQDASFGAHLLLSTASLSILGYEHHLPAIILWNQTS